MSRCARRIDVEVLSLLLDPAAPVWAVEDLAREVGDRVTMADSLARLHAAGLVHRIEPGFVFVTRVAQRGAQLVR